ncbi:hypothetical protein DN752_13765 [Echinicola strongylocentroti]|uniref:Uncharacterized protein n=1 Tax=Echinicola strongylocentroti TaxID=1795355 RepID=A0A2Z4IK36_9BACT|nr:hypothetical protein [Echinicola strongylocentroti]AWW31107.1 hypothetical protein DN752_13765 [Echinicola strongylocentroti]
MNRRFFATVILLIFGLLLFSCSTKSTIIKNQYCTVCMDKQDTVVVDIHLPALTMSENTALNNIVIGLLKDQGFQHVFRWYELEYDLLVNGIKSVETAEDLALAHQKLGVKYVVKSNLERYLERQGNSDNVSKPTQTNPHPRGPVPVSNESTVSLNLIEAHHNQLASKLTILTQGRVRTRDDDDYGTSFSSNASAWTTLEDGTRRGARFMIDDCQCPKGKYARRKKTK